MKVTKSIKEGLSLDDELQRSLSNISIWNGLIQVGAIGLVFLSNILLARLLGVYEYGVYTFAFSLAFVISGVSTSGFVNLLIRRTSEYKDSNSPGLLKGIFRWSTTWSLTIGCILASTIYLLSNSTGIFGEGDSKVIPIAMAIVPISVMSILFQSALNGGNFIISSIVPEKVIKPLLFVIAIYLSSLLSDELNAYTAAILNSGAIFIALAVALYLFHQNISKGYLGHAVKHDKPMWKKNYIQLLALGLVSILNSRTDVLMLGFLRDSNEVGIYNVAFKLSEFITFSLFVVNIGLAPLIAKHFAANNTKQLQSLVTKSARYTVAIALPLVLILVLLGKEILSIFGTEFVSGYYCLIGLSIAQLISVLAGSSGYILSMTGNENSATFSMIVSLLLNVILNFIFIPVMGMEGAAIATAISLILWNIMMTAQAKIKTGINPTFIGR